MIVRKSGRILNVASLAGFMATPGMTVYGATKAYVLSFSQGLAEELAGSGVTVNALCPGATATRFAQRAAIENTAMFKTAMTAQVVAKIGVRGLLKGRRVQVAGLINTITIFFIRFLPRNLLTKAVYGLIKA